MVTSDMKPTTLPAARRPPRTSTVMIEISPEKIGIFVSHRLRLELSSAKDTSVQQAQTLVD